MTLFVPDQNPDDIDEDEERELRQTLSNKPYHIVYMICFGAHVSTI